MGIFLHKRNSKTRQDAPDFSKKNRGPLVSFVFPRTVLGNPREALCRLAQKRVQCYTVGTNAFGLALRKKGKQF